jgi:hypothetical protein
MPEERTLLAVFLIWASFVLDQKGFFVKDEIFLLTSVLFFKNENNVPDPLSAHKVLYVPVPGSRWQTGKYDILPNLIK